MIGTIKFLVEVVVTSPTVLTSVKVLEDEVSSIKKGKWSDDYQDWQAIVVMKDGSEFTTMLHCFSKILGVFRDKIS